MAVWLWVGFGAFVAVMLVIDLGVVNRKTHAISVTEAAIWSTIWFALALCFNVGVLYIYDHHLLGIGLEPEPAVSGKAAALQFFTGYVIEKSLSLDNIFVIAMIFAYFAVPARLQHRVLFYGVVGAIVMRGVMIAAGTALIRQFTWITYVFGALLLATAIKMFVVRHDKLAPGRNPLVRLARWMFPVSEELDGERFFTRINGRRAITPLFLVLLVVESADLLFAVDSIPAIFAITQDPFLVFTSNVFAILGLRSIYFVLAGVMDRFRYLKVSLVLVLAFVGCKMLLAHHYPIPIVVSLGVIAGILALGLLASLVVQGIDKKALVSPLAAEMEAAALAAWKQARHFLVIVIGVTVLLLGLAMMVLPGPALLVIPAGLAILGTEFLWARKLLSNMRSKASGLLFAARRQRDTQTDSATRDAQAPDPE